jgi:hypothetical protein
MRRHRFREKGGVDKGGATKFATKSKRRGDLRGLEP